MAGTNRQLNSAKANPRDDFYTRYEDIEAELGHYRAHFKGAAVLCNCDDPYESNFFKYFAVNFHFLGLRKLIATCYATSPVMYTQLPLFGEESGAAVTLVPGQPRRPYKAVLTDVPGRLTPAGVADFLRSRGCVALLEGDGDFASAECAALMDQADIVATNPPFSKFRGFVAMLMSRRKRFVIIGDKNAVTYKEMFPLIMGGDVWVGMTPMSREVYFDVPQAFINENLALGKNRTIVKVRGRYMARSRAIWYTNLEIPRRTEELPLWRRYSPRDYPRYDNYDAIEVPKVKDIPRDYGGVMGVPITFLDKHNPKQFEIVGEANHGCDSEYDLFKPTIGGKPIFKRLLIRRR